MENRSEPTKHVDLPTKPERKDFRSNRKFLEAYGKYRRERQKALKEAGKDPVVEKVIMEFKELRQKRKKEISKWRKQELNDGSQSFIDRFLGDE